MVRDWDQTAGARAMSTTVREVPSQEATPLDRFLNVLRCPTTGTRLVPERDSLVSVDGTHRYRVNAAGTPLFAESAVSHESEAQRRHYDKIATAFTANLE